MVKGDVIVDYARKREFMSDWGRVRPDPVELVKQVKHFTETENLPIIVCQQWRQNPNLGHYRVVIGIDDEGVVFHDPEPGVGGPNLQLSLSEFMDQWRPTGGNVTGGVAIWIANREILSPLDPGQPNLWVL